MLFKLWIIFIYSTSFVITTNTSKCADIDRAEIENHLSTKTPYRVISNRNDKEIRVKGCRPIRIWAIIRHGTRNPSKGDIQRCKEDLTKIREQILTSKNSNLCQHEFAMFRNWSCNNLNVENAKDLVYEGEDELIELAERMQNRFPSLLIDHYHPSRYKFKYTLTKRTVKSADSFAIGLFGRNKIKQIQYEEPMKKDPILRFYKLCKRWLHDVDSNPNSINESRQFIEGQEMENLVKLISIRTGLTQLSSDDVMLMYKFCAFETAWNKKRLSPWCMLFENKTIQIPEFAEDLEYYWIDGYGHELTHKQACPAIKNMIEHIRPHSNEPNATFYFTHSGTILKLLAHMNLYQDDFALTHADFKKERKWKVSKIDAFASNIAFILFDCGKNEPRVLVMHQERVVNLPIEGCPDSDGLCSLKKVEDYFMDSIHNCNFDEICSLN